MNQIKARRLPVYKSIDRSYPLNLINKKLASKFGLKSLEQIEIYNSSVIGFKNNTFFIGKRDTEKSLYIICRDLKETSGFEGFIEESRSSVFLKKCAMITKNRIELQKIFPFTIPVKIGLKNSFGFGDRIGFANAGHLRALGRLKFVPVLAQQSIRELTRTMRSAEDVLDAAVWAVFQEGFKKGFSADADHLKTTEDIDMFVKAGFVMFTFDPGQFVNNDADNLNIKELTEVLKDYPWDELNDSLADARQRYLNDSVTINRNLTIQPGEVDILRAYTKYGRSLAHVKKLHDHLKNKYPGYLSEIEVSVDETQAVTSIFEHYFISKELHRLQVKYVSLAPRFVGDFEKGIDYKGDLKLFEEEFRKHAAIVKFFGDYKISLHSGSDKFSVYKVIGKFKKGAIHVKTAGTSYLEALKVVALKEPDLFRNILDYSKMYYAGEKLSYHVSANIENVKKSAEYLDDELFGLFDSNDVRQILHVTYGKVLSDKDKNGEFIFKGKIINCLKKNEDVHYNLLIKHFNKHLKPFRLD
ncbi:MAG TPA: tagaturonate epimerase family protein [Ignavibacteriaceae bacterium]|nr:tagaturonate epimerase family protein [Ignavibacteriaceae bacterium]